MCACVCRHVFVCVFVCACAHVHLCMWSRVRGTWLCIYIHSHRSILGVLLHCSSQFCFYFKSCACVCVCTCVYITLSLMALDSTAQKENTEFLQEQKLSAPPTPPTPHPVFPPLFLLVSFWIPDQAQTAPNTNFKPQRDPLLSKKGERLGR